MKVKIITANSPDSLQDEINQFLEFCPKVKSVNFGVGVGPNRAEFYALILFEA